MRKLTLWKFVIGKPMELDAVIAAADASAELASDGTDIRGVELQRVDRTQGMTVVFATTSDEGAHVFSKILSEHGGKTGYDKAAEKELALAEPVAG